MRLLPLIFFLGISISLWAQNDEYEVIVADHICKSHHNIVEQEASRYQAYASFRSNVLTQDYDLKYHRLEWEVDPAVNYIQGQVTSYFIPTTANFQAISFDLSQEMQVNSVEYHSNTITNFSHNANTLSIVLPNSIPFGQLDSITINYEGAPVSDGFGSFEVREHNGMPILWTLSQPYGARDWWPCKQSLNDKIDSIDVIVTSPSAYRTASNGLLIQEEEIQGDRRRSHWKHRYPIPAYLIAIAVTNYSVYSDYVIMPNGDSLEILNYVYPENLTEAQNGLSRSIELMSVFNELFGPYPFAKEKYGHAQFGFIGGMEHQTMSFMGTFGIQLQAHELAHQWFGDAITCGSWQDIWLNEGFATYSEGLAFETVLAGSIWWDEWKRVATNHITEVPDGSVLARDTSSADTIFYNRMIQVKAAYLLHMLRWKMGDDNFFQAVRNYVQDPSLAYSYARADDLKRHLEQQSGEDLTSFFQKWYLGEGWPSYTVKAENTNTGIEIILEQSTSHPSVSFYELPVPLQLKGEGQDTIVRLDHTFSGQLFDIDLPFQVDSIFFDPDRWILSANNEIQFGPTTSIRSTAIASSVEVYPNPFQNSLHFKVSSSTTDIRAIKIYTVQGQLLQEWSRGATKELTILTEAWPRGVYLVNVMTNQGMVTKKVVK